MSQSSDSSNRNDNKRMMSWPFNQFESSPILTGELAAGDFYIREVIIIIANNF